MNTINFLTLLLLTFSSVTLFAQDQAIYVNRTTVVDLKQNKAELHFGLPYPGEISGLCGIEIRTDGDDLSALFPLLEIENTLGVEPVVSLGHRNRIITLDFSHAGGTYGTWFTIKSISGESLKTVIKDSIGNHFNLILMAKSCH